MWPRDQCHLHTWKRFDRLLPLAALRVAGERTTENLENDEQCVYPKYIRIDLKPLGFDGRTYLCDLVVQIKGFCSISIIKTLETNATKRNAFLLRLSLGSEQVIMLSTAFKCIGDLGTDRCTTSKLCDKKVYFSLVPYVAPTHQNEKPIGGSSDNFDGCNRARNFASASTWALATPPRQMYV